MAPEIYAIQQKIDLVPGLLRSFLIGSVSPFVSEHSTQ